jgi:hypothetical protein
VLPAAQLGVYRRRKLVQRRLIALAPRPQKARDISACNSRKPPDGRPFIIAPYDPLPDQQVTRLNVVLN